MKPLTTILLAASLVANAALAYAAFSGSARLSDEAAAASAAVEAAKKAPRSSGPAPVDPKTWSSLETKDLTALAANLREAGFPKDVIRAMISGLLSEQFAARRRALDPDSANRPYWKDRAPDLKLQLAQYQLFREQEKALRAILGADARNTDPLAQARARSMFGNLPPEKLDAAQLIIDEFNQKQTEAYYTKGSMTMADQRQIERDQRTALAAILSPAELEEYDLRSSNTGRTMRRELTSFAPTEEEFRAIYKLRQPFEEKYNYDSGIPSQATMNERMNAQKQLMTDIKNLLSPERAAEYERASDFNFQRASQLVARLELPPETTTTLWNTQKEFEKRRNDIYSSGASLSAEERTRQLTALQQEAIAKLTPILGSASRVKSYESYGGQWLTSLVPRPRPPQ
ncbi:MAG: hypothetical protein NTV51_13835 [Verrucomicrobia bacterium]|nr:hypothetical protein [Verrucomicrobiota bacterium]